MKLFDNSRRLVWFSCGAASACAAKLSRQKYGNDCQVLHCDTLSTEHPDNVRFMADITRWIGCEIISIRSLKYRDTWDVYEKERWLNGVGGARCTTELKKVPRWDYQGPDDIHIFGFTADEEKRIKKFEAMNIERCEWILRDAGVTKQDCYAMLQAASIRLPQMYLDGYHNNNCIGCVKGGAGYWNKIRRDYLAVFTRMALLEREIGASCIKGVYLDELDPKAGNYKDEIIECGPVCQTGEDA